MLCRMVKLTIQKVRARTKAKTGVYEQCLLNWLDATHALAQYKQSVQKYQKREGSPRLDNVINLTQVTWTTKNENTCCLGPLIIIIGQQ